MSEEVKSIEEVANSKEDDIVEDQEIDKELLIKNEEDILELIKKDNSWEQVIYQVVALENLDPWNLDINILCGGFAEYVSTIKELDFRIPAKWVIIASMLLRMKSDCIKILKMDEDIEEEQEFMDWEEIEEMADAQQAESKIDMDPIDVVVKRKPIRKVTISELVGSLRNVLKANKRKQDKHQERKERIKINQEDFSKRIDNLYKKIGNMFTKIKQNEIRFTNLVGSWKRGQIIDTFLPLIHLDNESKVICKQKEIFEEILIKKKAGSRPN